MPSRFKTRSLRSAVAAVLIVLAPVPGAGRPAGEAEDVASLEALRALDLRVATVGHRLMRAGLPLCGGRAPQAGLVLHDAAQYGGDLRAVAVRHFGFGDGPSISAVVPGGAADAAGLRADDAVLAINGTRFGAVEVGRRSRPTYDGVAQAATALENAMARGPVVLTVRRAGTRFDALLKPVETCSSEVQLITSRRMDAVADGQYVQVTSALADFVASDDELAVVIGHELAHNILGHRAKLDTEGVGTGLSSRFGKQAAKVRATEIEADRLGLRLMALAGYDLAAAPAFWRRFGKEHGPGIFADATHPSWRKREAALADEIRILRAEASEGQGR